MAVQDDRAGGVKGAQVHAPGVQVNAAVESRLLGIEAPANTPGGGGGLIPHRGREVYAP